MARRGAQRTWRLAVQQVLDTAPNFPQLADRELALVVQRGVRRHGQANCGRGRRIGLESNIVRLGQCILVAVAVVQAQRVEHAARFKRSGNAHDVAERYRIINTKLVHAVFPHIVRARTRVVSLEHVGAVDVGRQLAERILLADRHVPVDAAVMRTADINRCTQECPVHLSSGRIRIGRKQLAEFGRFGRIKGLRFADGRHLVAHLDVPQVGAKRDVGRRVDAESHRELLRLLRLQVFVAAALDRVLRLDCIAVGRIFGQQVRRAVAGRRGYAGAHHRAGDRFLVGDPETRAIRGAQQHGRGRRVARGDLVGRRILRLADVAFGQRILDCRVFIVTHGRRHFQVAHQRQVQLAESAG